MLQRVTTGSELVASELSAIARGGCCGAAVEDCCSDARVKVRSCETGLDLATPWRHIDEAERARRISLGWDVLNAACARYAVPVDAVHSSSRRRECVHVRRVIAWACRWWLGLSLPEIGRVVRGVESRGWRRSHHSSAATMLRWVAADGSRVVMVDAAARELVLDVIASASVGVSVGASDGGCD